MTDTPQSSTSLCVHGHFYQPPREDPLTGEIPREKGAEPFHDWNERIFAECYLPNLEAGNFSRMSFNVGPTLFTWLDQSYPQAVSMLIEEDRKNVARFGVGNAMAQPYNHTILPLATHEDKVTQIAWGIADFQHRFGRSPEGMWLPEAAVDLDTLNIMAQQGISFTILAPWQAAQNDFNPTVPYHIALSDNRSMTVFFYEAELSMLVSFEPNATSNADAFVYEHLKRMDDKFPLMQHRLLTIASDAELYGHHQPNRDKFLSYLLKQAAPQAGYEVLYPALWLKKYSVDQSTEIHDNTSWSCHHGVSRWNGSCTCTENAQWKSTFRSIFDKLGADLDEIYLNQTHSILEYPQEAKNGFIKVVLNQLSFSEFLDRYAKPGVRFEKDEKNRLHLLFQAQWERQRMFTSCAWFFEDFDRIEPQNVVAYLAQAIWLTWQASGIDLSTKAESALSEVRSNRMELSADTVFLQHWNRANAYGFKIKQGPPYQSYIR
jgi:alpha-amylase/alpha-mannosidase (GH57 family)